MEQGGQFDHDRTKDISLKETSDRRGSGDIDEAKREEKVEARVGNQNAEEDHNVNFGALFSEVKNWRTHFSFSGLATALVLGLLPSLWDSGSDFGFGKEEQETKS